MIFLISEFHYAAQQVNKADQPPRRHSEKPFNYIGDCRWLAVYLDADRLPRETPVTLIKNGLGLLALIAVVFGLTACNAVGGGSSKSDSEDWVWAGIPNSRILMFSRAADPHGYGEMYLLTKQGEIRQIVDNTHHNNNPSITRNGDRVAFHRWMIPDDFASLEVFMLDIGTGIETRLTDDVFATTIPKWSADGTKLAYSSWRTYDTVYRGQSFRA